MSNPYGPPPNGGDQNPEYSYGSDPQSGPHTHYQAFPQESAYPQVQVGPGIPYVIRPDGTPQPVGWWSRRSKLAGGLFGIFLGTFGVHNFYLGFTGKAVTQLLITVLSLGFLSPVTSIWGLIEGILVLSSATGTKWDLDAEGYPMAPIGS